MQTAQPHVFWFTGLPASGKTTLAQALRQRLRESGQATCVLDGDELRRGLCSDLGLSAEDRTENIRRAGEVARLMHDAGLHVACAFVSPFRADRERVRALFAPSQFTEIHVATSLEECMRRDPKGLYEKARRGELRGLTGWDAPFEAPRHPTFRFDTANQPQSEMIDMLMARLAPMRPT